VNKVIGANLADAPPRIAQLRVAADACDAEALRQAAHALKSSSANVGAEQLAALCKELECSTAAMAATACGRSLRAPKRLSRASPWQWLHNWTQKHVRWLALSSVWKIPLKHK